MKKNKSKKEDLVDKIKKHEKLIKHHEEKINELKTELKDLVRIGFRFY